MEQTQDQVDLEELPRRNAKVFSDRLCTLVDSFHIQFNGETEKRQIPIVISFQKQIPKPTKEERRNLIPYFKLHHPKTTAYLENNDIEYLPLGFSSGEIVANPTISQLDDLRDLGEINEIDSAPNEFRTYQRILGK